MIILLLIGLVFTVAAINSDALLDIKDILTKYNYTCKEHTAITEDGYIITIFQIYSKLYEASNKRQPVYLQHGVFCTPEAFISGGLDGSITYLLADKGYDVWIAGSRGTRYSKKHINYTTSDKRYWNFTFEEQGVYDQRAVIDYIVNTTGFQKVHYYSHSMGGTQMLAALLVDTDYYRQHLLSAIMTGPVFRFDTTSSIFIQTMNYTKLPYIFYDMGIYEFLPGIEWIEKFLMYIESFAPSIGAFVIKLVADETMDIVNLHNVQIFLAHFPAGTSTKCFKHLVQLTENTGFYKYREKVTDPLEFYDLSNIPDDIPLAVFIGEYDMLGSPESMVWFKEQMIKLGKKIHMKIYKDLSHTAFLAPLKKNFGFLYDAMDFFSAAEGMRST